MRLSLEREAGVKWLANFLKPSKRFHRRFKYHLDEPSPVVLASGGLGWGGDAWFIASDDRAWLRPVKGSKPPYRVPSMEEIARTPRNGSRIASTFSGAGGSCLGYRMAGFEVLWANEFVPGAQESYRANMEPGCVLDGRDVRTVAPEDVLGALGLAKGELDVLDGSPPCQAFSTVGRRERGWGKEKVYEHGATQRNEDLFFEYARLLRGLMPRAFVAENVAGLARGVAKGYFLDILTELKAAGYRVEAQILDAKWLGVPQSRNRIFFVGMRDDLEFTFEFPRPLPHRYSILDALPELVDEPNGPPRKLTIRELKRLCSFPDDFALAGSYRQQWAQLGNSVPPTMMFHVARALASALKPT